MLAVKAIFIHHLQIVLIRGTFSGFLPFCRRAFLVSSGTSTYIIAWPRNYRNPDEKTFHSTNPEHVELRRSYSFFPDEFLYFSWKD